MVIKEGGVVGELLGGVVGHLPQSEAHVEQVSFPLHFLSPQYDAVGVVGVVGVEGLGHWPQSDEQEEQVSVPLQAPSPQYGALGGWLVGP